MAYIGKQPVVGNFVKLDAITTSATATYNLLNGGVAYFPQTANNCIVSLNGVIQSPTSAYTISGSTIVFDSALTSDDSIDFILVLGDVLNIGTPSDGTVSLAKLTATGTKDATTFLRGDNTFQTILGTPTVDTFDTGTAATYTKPSSANWILVEIWGGGGSGGDSSAGGSGGGGGGGAYNYFMTPFSNLVGNVTYTVGAGAAAATVTNTNGNTGGTSEVNFANFSGSGITKTISVFGGGGGGSGGAGGQPGLGGGPGGGGGGIFSAGTTGSSGNPGVGGDPSTTAFGGTNGSELVLGTTSIYGGSGGGQGNSTTGAGGTGNNSLYGGAGGGGGSDQGTTGGIGGISQFGGNGGNGGLNGGAPTAGSVPAGGGGGSEAQSSGAGGSGRVRFTYW